MINQDDRKTVGQRTAEVEDPLSMRIGRDTTPDYYGEIVHSFGEGYNQEYCDHMDMEWQDGKRHGLSVKRREALAAFEERYNGNPFADSETQSAAMVDLANDLSLAVDCTLGNDDRLQAEYEISGKVFAKLSGKFDAYERLLRETSEIFEDQDPLQVVERLAAWISEKGSDGLYHELMGTAESIGKLKGQCILKGEEIPEGFRRGYSDIYSTRDTLREFGIAAYDRDRAKAYDRIFMWANRGDRFIDLEIGLPNLFHDIERAGELIAFARGEDGQPKPRDVVKQYADEQVDAYRRQADKIKARYKGHPGRVFYPQAVVEAMKGIRLRDLRSSGIENESLKLAHKILEEISSGKRPSPA